MVYTIPLASQLIHYSPICKLLYALEFGIEAVQAQA